MLRRLKEGRNTVWEAVIFPSLQIISVRGPMMLNSVVSYLRAGLLLNCLTLVEFILLCAAGPELLPNKSDCLLKSLFKGWLLIFLTSLPVFSQLDARCRYQDYKRVKDQLFRFGFDTRIIKTLLKSRCQRDAARVAALESGYGEYCRAFYRKQGYRWYHILPDFLFSRPQFLISRHFWQSTFFLKTYHGSKFV